jgi:hypothetical protein
MLEDFLFIALGIQFVNATIEDKKAEEEASRRGYIFAYAILHSMNYLEVKNKLANGELKESDVFR